MLLKICSRIKKFIIIIIKIKLTLQLPIKKKIVLYDKHAYHKIYKILPKNDFHILKVRIEEINILIFLKNLVNLKFSYFAYLESYIKYINPKILITFVDNNFNFYKHHFKNIVKIAVQNGRRIDPENFRSQVDNKINFYTDYIFTYNDNDRKIYENIGGIKSKKFIAHGSYKLNSIIESKSKSKSKSKTKKFDFIYVSTFRKFYNEETSKVYKNVSSSEYIKYEIKLIKIISEFSMKYNKKISILMRYPENHENSTNEKNFYSEHLASTKKISFIFSKNYIEFDVLDKNKTDSKRILSSYENLYLANVVIGVDSTLLYEALAAGHKVAFFSIRGKKNCLKYRTFAWPYKISNTGFFWNSRLDKKDIYNVLNNLLNITNNNWKNYVKKYSYIMKKDPGNKKLKKLINSIA